LGWAAVSRATVGVDGLGGDAGTAAGVGGTAWSRGASTGASTAASARVSGTAGMER